MKRYVCTVVAGMLLALTSAGVASAGLPILGDAQQGTQSTSFGDQSVDKQKNDADVYQAQGNGNVNIAPAISIFGDSSTRNEQGNGNTAVAVVDQSNSASQSQSAEQQQTLGQGGSDGACCTGSSQSGEQRVSGADQSIGEQRNDTDVSQEQGNGNVNLAPAVSVFGDASTWSAQGNGNTAVAAVDQSNQATQSQWASQRQDLSQQAGGCCEKPKHGYGKPDGKGPKQECCDGQSQTGEQKVRFGDQSIGKQKNDADVTQEQGNGNVNVSPAVSSPPVKRAPCEKETYGMCGGSSEKGYGNASTWNAQGNGNVALAGVGQSNEANQSQSSSQAQSLVQDCCDAALRE
jgi:hypothetical protein